MLVITLGDPFSINQNCLVQLQSHWATAKPGPVVLVGSLQQWEFQSRKFNWPTFPWQIMSDWREVRQKAGLYFYSIDDQSSSALREPAQLSLEERGTIACKALWALRELSPSRSLAVLTCPIDKKAASTAGFTYPGQTEYFEAIWKQAGIMILAGPRLRVALATNHLPLSAVPGSITTELVQNKIRLFREALRDIFGIASPRLAVAALNPHAGDQGLFGSEDAGILAPAIRAAANEGYQVSGPHPADTVFFRAYEGQFDGVLAMYHDQGLGPLKTAHFYDAINVTGGLPALRLSPDHGPAADLFGSDAARADSFRQALLQAHHYLGW